MRRATKAQVAKAIAGYNDWRPRINARLSKIDRKGAKIIAEWADDVCGRINAADLSICTSSLIRSVERAIEDFETGYYTGVTHHGGFIVRTA